MKPASKKILLIAAVVLFILLYFIFDARQGTFPKCPFHLITGFYCPGCGSQRAVSALLHGDIAAALQYNVLLILFLPLLLYAGLMNLRNWGAPNMRLWYHPLFAKIVLITILCFWLFRNIPLHPFTLLAPVN